MPWHVEEDREDCQGFAVIKDEDGSLAGCHRTEAQADRQLAALYASEENNRAVGDPPAIVTDIDGTLLIGDGVNTDLVETLNDSDAAILVVSAREPDQRPQTENRLAAIGLNYDELFLVGGSNATTAKVKKVNELLDRYDIIAAYENNETTRRAYTDIGIDARNPISNRSIAEQILAEIRDRG
jgi:hypothetical protein